MGIDLDSRPLDGLKELKLIGESSDLAQINHAMSQGSQPLNTASGMTAEVQRSIANEHLTGGSRHGLSRQEIAKIQADLANARPVGGAALGFSEQEIAKMQAESDNVRPPS